MSTEPAPKMRILCSARRRRLGNRCTNSTACKQTVVGSVIATFLSGTVESASIRYWSGMVIYCAKPPVHLLFLDGVYAEDTWGEIHCHRVKTPAQEERLRLAHSLKSTHSLSQRVARFLESRGLLERDIENSYLVFEQQEAGAPQPLFGHSISYRIALGPIRDAKVFTLQIVPPRAHSDDSAQAAQVAGFSLPAGAVAEPHRRDKLARLCG